MPDYKPPNPEVPVVHGLPSVTEKQYEVEEIPYEQKPKVSFISQKFKKKPIKFLTIFMNLLKEYTIYYTTTTTTTTTTYTTTTTTTTYTTTTTTTTYTTTTTTTTTTYTTTPYYSTTEGYAKEEYHVEVKPNYNEFDHGKAGTKCMK